MKKKMQENPEMWGVRPLKKDQLCYAAEDVAFLIKTWFSLKDLLNENLLEMTYFITILKVVNKNLYSQFVEHLIASVLLFIKSSDMEKEERLKDKKKNRVEGSIDGDDVSEDDRSAYVAKQLINFDYVDNFFQLKSITKNELSQNSTTTNLIHGSPTTLYDIKRLSSDCEEGTNDSKMIINLCLSYKNMQRDYFRGLLHQK
eukprot:CAMPEP_0170521288 /NCGR_PEP_ID=MMETSP0209-20121228/6601_1 /TAXON_ID=665100 ORGANISM="Litonotus pictus, Strain P1" /NCGR_SAMPLE_ID=MMETSP0209 /ASSEMBLY_ACC=CAM_ASM_000301 /LENGTH=200 /DNA_ID=CAMNT_0010808039 /DNA_START=609 /DNA_END=1211 /DNA_ORIENTATION=+